MCSRGDMFTSQRYLLYLSYLGTRFRGSQKQNLKAGESPVETVQGTLEAALKDFYGVHGDDVISTVLSSRTDSGVHALKSAVHVDLPLHRGRLIRPISLQNVLNKRFELSEADIRVTDALFVPKTFSARFSALGKTYMYRVAFLKDGVKEKQSIPISELNRTHFYKNKKFDLEKAESILEYFIGKKDYASFAHKLAQNPRNTICMVNSFKVVKGDPFMPGYDVSDDYDYYSFIVNGRSFLYRMVRRMVSAVISFACDGICLDELKFMFDQPHHESWNSKIGVLPGRGLYLVNVEYDENDLKLSDEDEATISKYKYKQHLEVPVSDRKPFSGFLEFTNKYQ